MSKQDRVYTRTAADLERKYKLGTPSNGGGDSQEISKLSQLLSQFMTSVNQNISAIETKLKNIGKPSAEDVSYTSSSLSATNVQDAIDELEEELEQKGDGGIYIGSGEMPEGCNVQIDPSGEIEEYVLKSEYDTKVAEIDSAISEQNKNITWKLAGSASGTNNVSIAGISYEEILIYIVNNKEGDGQAGWYDTSLVIPKVALINRQIINMPAFNHKEGEHLYCVCAYDKYNELIRIYVHALADTSVIDYSTLYVYYR